MQKIRIVLVANALMLAIAGFAWTGDNEEGRAIITKAIKAAGGADNLAKHKAATYTEKGTYYGMGEGLPYTGKYAMQYPNQFRMEIEGFFTMVINGDKGWTSAEGKVKEMSKEELASQQNDHKAGWIGSLLPLTDKAYMLKKVGEAKVDGKSAVIVQVTRTDYPTVKLYFDTDSYLLVKSEYTTKAADLKFKEVPMESYYKDYREVDGAKVPHKMVMKRDGKVFIESEVTSMKAEGKLDAKVFAEPK